MAKIEGRGFPTRNIVGQKGDIYTDLNTGVKYECLGLRGFIDIDSVDEPVECRWKRIETIDMNQLPEELQIGETTVYSNTVYWDGKKDGKKTTTLFGNTWYSVSHLCPNEDEILAGGMMAIGDEKGPYAGMINKPMDGIYWMTGMFAFVYKDGVYEGANVRKGIYIKDEYADMTWEFEFNDFNGFESPGIKPFNIRYFPKQLQIGELAEQYVIYEGNYTAEDDSNGHYRFRIPNMEESRSFLQSTFGTDRKPYIVEFDGKKYTILMHIDSIGGNESLVAYGSPDNKLPFAVGYSVESGKTYLELYAKDMDQHSIKFYTYDPIVVTTKLMDIKWLPMDEIIAAVKASM